MIVGDEETTTGKLTIGVCICIGPDMVALLIIGGGELNMGCATDVAPIISPELLLTGCVVLLTTLPVATILACS